MLLVREGLTSDLSELHSTPWSSVRVLDPTDRRALDFLRAWRRPGPSDAALELDVDTLLSQQYSGKSGWPVRTGTISELGQNPERAEIETSSFCCR